MQPATSTPSASAAPAGPRLPNLLVQNRNFVFLWFAYGISAFGDHLSEVALLQERGGMNRPDATRIQALITFGFFLPFVLLGPLAGWWSDRFSRRTTMIAVDLLRAGIVFNLGLIVARLTGWLEPHGLGDFSIVLPLALVGALAAFFSPARQAMLPTLIRDDHLVRANALINALGTVGGILSAVLGGWLAERAARGEYSRELNYHLNTATFVLSAIFVFLIDMKRTRAVPHPKLAGIWLPVIDGFRYVRTHRRIFQMILIGTVFWAAAGVVVSIVPALVRDVFGGNLTAIGKYRGLLVVGLAAGAAVMTIIGPALPMAFAIIGSLAGAGFWLLALDAAYVFKLGAIFAGFCLFMVGAHGAGLLVTIMATIQRFVPDARRGRVFGVADMATMGAMVLATGLLGIPHIPNLDRYVPFLLALIGGVMLLATGLAYRVYRRESPYPRFLGFMIKLVQFYANFWCRLQRVGPCTVPRQGPVILAANHTAGIDPLVLQSTCTHRVISFIVAQEYYNRPIAGWFMRLAECIPIDRANPGKSFLVGCLKKLKEGGCLGIFPQGRFVRPGEEVEAKSGVGVLALRTGATVIPCHISGTKYEDSVLKGFFIRHNVRVRYGPPVDLSAFTGKERDPDAAQQVSDLILAKILELAPETADEPEAEERKNS